MFSFKLLSCSEKLAIPLVFIITEFNKVGLWLLAEKQKPCSVIGVPPSEMMVPLIESPKKSIWLGLLVSTFGRLEAFPGHWTSIGSE